MESFENSEHNSTDFEFKYIPVKEFQRIVMKVQRERKLESAGIWGNFCSVSSEKDDEVPDEKAKSKILTGDEVRSVISDQKSTRRTLSMSAPLLGPYRKFDAQTLRKEKSKSSSESSEVESVHIVEEVNVVQPLSDKIQVPNQVASGISSTDDSDSLHNEMLKLCYEIENANGTASDFSIDSSDQEDKRKKTSKSISQTFKLIEEKFILNDDDDSDDEAKAQAKVQTLPVVELERNDDFTNDNNVWSPKVGNQISASGKRRGEEKSSVKAKRHDEVFPRDAVAHAATSKRDVNEKSHDGARFSGVDVKQGKSRKEQQVVVLSALGRITQFQSKICKYLDCLREIIGDPPEIEDMNDLKKRQSRATEFSHRFARNHLYQIGRIAEEVRLMPDNPLNVATKVNLLFQVIMQAVQSYLRHVEMFIYNSNPDKLLVLVDFIINAMKICFDRMVFDKRDLMIQQMLRLCSDIKGFLEVNKNSFAKFVSIPEKRSKSLSSRSKFAYEVPGGSKLSMYDAPKMNKTRSGSLSMLAPTRSPYDAPQPTNLKSKPKQQSSNKRNAPSRIKSPILRKTTSNPGTMVQKMNKQDSADGAKTKAEAPAPTPKEAELMTMLQNIAKDKIEEMLAPFLNKLKDPFEFKQAEAGRRSSQPKTPPLSTTFDVPRVTSDVEKKPKKPKVLETVERISKNVQYLYVKSHDEPEKEASASSSKSQLEGHKADDAKAICERAEKKTKVLSAKMKPPVQAKLKSDEKFMKQFKEQALKERLEYFEQMRENPLYVNKAHGQPWKMIGGISDKILDELLESVVAELDFGEKDFVESFLRHELEC